MSDCKCACSCGAGGLGPEKDATGQVVSGGGAPGGVTSSAVTPTSSTITAADRLDHVMARWGVNRYGHRVSPGLYSLGGPGPDAPVFVTANYTLSFDALRTALAGIDSYILVLDTKGINVWCAAGKGTFGTDELVRRVAECGLADVVGHRRLIVPQLGATGVEAREVLRRTGFSVRFGPVRADDIRRYLDTGVATSEMRTVRFGIADRAVLIPVELVHVLAPALIAALVLYFLSGPLVAWAVIASLVAGAVLFPLTLPWLPTPNFSTKGAVLGLVVAAPFATAAIAGDGALWARIAWAAGLLAAMPSLTAFLSLNFTGSSTYTSRTGVKREIMAYFPVMAWSFGAGLVLILGLTIARLVGGI